MDEIVLNAMNSHPNVAPSPLQTDFNTLSEALDLAALSDTGMNFYNARGEREHALSYATIRIRALSLARNLLGLGLSRGDHVGIIADMHPDFVCAFFACQYAGLLAVPLPVATTLGGAQGYLDQLTTVLENSDARIALGPTSSLDNLNQAAAGTAVEFVKTTSMLAEGPATKEALQPLDKDSVSHIQFSSGSTRQPLGIKISQAAIKANSRSIAQDALGITSADRVASWLPFYHDMGLVGCMIVPVTCQVTVDYLYTDAFIRRPTLWLQIISENQCTVSFSPAFGYDICTRRLKGINGSKLDLSKWRVAGIGGDMIDAGIIGRFCKAYAGHGFQATSFVPSYGLAEATLAFSFEKLGVGLTVDHIEKRASTNEMIARKIVRNGKTVDGGDIRAITSCGSPMPGYGLQIRNDRGKELGDREIGNVFIKGPSLMNGYHLNNGATDACIDDDGWLDTGDMGYVSDEAFYVTGRRKDMIIINGRNIWPQDLEWYAENGVEALRVRDTAAFATIGLNGGEEIVILVQCRSSDPVARAELRKEIRGAVFTNSGVDCRVELIPNRSLPFTTSGKLQRGKAKTLWLEGEYSTGGSEVDELIVSHAS